MPRSFPRARRGAIFFWMMLTLCVCFGYGVYVVQKGRAFATNGANAADDVAVRAPADDSAPKSTSKAQASSPPVPQTMFEDRKPREEPSLAMPAAGAPLKKGAISIKRVRPPSKRLAQPADR